MSIIKGLINMGNTCYLNAAFQMLVQNDDFCELVHQQTHPEMLELSKFIREYKDASNNNALTPQIVKQMVDIANSMFRGNDQHDSYEFLVYFIDYINSRSNNAFKALFECEIEQTIKCKIRACLRTSITNEMYYCLSVPIKPHCTTLTDCYHEFKIHEKLEDDEMYFCENCNGKRVASRKIVVSRWPKHLIIHLKRFVNTQRKIDSPIDVRLMWRHDYELQGGVIHTGSHSGGHYTYVTKTNTSWSICDDRTISYISEERALLYFKKAFILYYRKLE